VHVAYGRGRGSVLNRQGDEIPRIMCSRGVVLPYSQYIVTRSVPLQHTVTYRHKPTSAADTDGLQCRPTVGLTADDIVGHQGGPTAVKGHRMKEKAFIYCCVFFSLNDSCHNVGSKQKITPKL